MFTCRIAVSLLTVLVLLWQSAVSGETKPDKYRVELNSGERFVVYSGKLTSDSLIGTSFSGVARSVPLRSISMLEEADGNYAKRGAVVGLTVGLMCALVSVLQIESEASAQPSNDHDESEIALKVFGFTGGGTLIGLAAGLAVTRWEEVAWNRPIATSTDSRRLGLRFSVSF